MSTNSRASMQRLYLRGLVARGEIGPDELRQPLAPTEQHFDALAPTRLLAEAWEEEQEETDVR